MPISNAKRELEAHPENERRELAAIYVARGLSQDLAGEVADALMSNDALKVHSRDELGITDDSAANPVQAALASAASFIAGGLPPLLTALLVPSQLVLWVIAGVAVVTLGLLGAAGARAGGAPVVPAVVRVVIWGSLAMAVTAGVGHFFHVSTG